MRILASIILLISCLWATIASAECSGCVPVLVYHDMDPVRKGSMTISTHKFEAQMQWLKANGYTFIPMKELVDYLQGKIASVPPKSIVITADDGRVAVYKYMWPIVKKYNIPVTLFIYPMIISHAPYALTWEQLKELKNTGEFDIEGHTYWHPNFKQEKKRLSQAAYEKLVHTQLVTSKKVIEEKLGIHVTLLAWPFGIYNDYLESQAEKAGYTMAFSIKYRCANRSEKPMSQPRFMIIEGQSMKTFETIVRCGTQPKMHAVK